MEHITFEGLLKDEVIYELSLRGIEFDITASAIALWKLLEDNPVPADTETEDAFISTLDVDKELQLGVAPFVGVVLGASWGCVAGLVPHWRDAFMAEIRILLVLLTGLFANYLAGNFGWGGTVGVGVLVCNAVAAYHWSKSGWPLNKNPAATAYRVIWSLGEPMLFAYTGTFFVLNTITGSMILRGLALLMACLTVRLTVVSLVCVGMPLKHRLFVCCAFTPKAIVETVLGPLTINTLLIYGGSPLEKEYAENWLRLLVQAIFITTPLGFLLTQYLGPWLLRSNIVDTYDIRRESENR